MRTSTTSDSGVPVGSRPVNVALVRLVSLVKTKSSADSISSLPAEPGREAVAILPSGLPVLKKKVLPACTGPLSAHATRANAANQSFEYIDPSFQSQEVERGAPATIQVV